ncbi:DUF4202 domain-containing protein [Formosa sediminum]|uniref:DUF4202 domain-containing protein n=1 Tax=Formosa sediminum TaxID=2594004 RepID=A0A516GQR3_9FLAO|nr:DUF4202 domain-containing protein [Formosa sediminum]QDO93877.1 DUF4202 domain-containing protein [Formosa sediminum]
MSTKFEQAIALIDEKNAQDLNREIDNGKSVPKELLYSQRMTACLLDYMPTASEALQIAVRAQHICRWEIPRKAYPMTKAGYMNWRNDLKKMHASLTAEILESVGYDDDFIARVKFIISKKALKKDPDSQTLEDVVCLVFLQYYFEDFAKKHEIDRLIDIVQKTWRKMSDAGHKKAMTIPFSESILNLIKEALA